MKSNFQACLAHIFQFEGGYVDHPRDPGGATNMGITHKTLANHRGRPVTKTDVKRLTKKEAGEIYRARYWNTVWGDDLPKGVDLVTFDPAVNSGPSRGVRWLQQAVGASQDGKMGSKTLAASKSMDPSAVIKKACSKRMGFLRGLGTWGTFGKGWSRRVASVEATAVYMAAGAAGAVAGKDEAELKSKTEAGAAGTTATGTGYGVWQSLETVDPIIIAMTVGVLALSALLFARSKHDRNRANAYKEILA